MKDAYGPVADIILGTGGTLAAARRALVGRIRRDPWHWVAGKDPLTGEPLVRTRDEGHPDGMRPFPADKEYLRQLFRVLHDSDRVFIEKSRQMIVSTACCLYVAWDCMVHRARRWLISRTTEDNSIELIRDKIRAPWMAGPDWLREVFPMTLQPAREVRFPATASYIKAVNQEVARRTARGGTATGLLLDEAAYQDYSREIYAASSPMAAKIFVVSTPALGPGGQFMKEMIEQADGAPPLTEYALREGLASEKA